MKRMTLTLLALLIAAPSFAQMSPGPRHSWFVGTGAKATTLDGSLSILSGIDAAYHINPSFALHFSSYVLANNVEAPLASPDGAENLHFWYSGFGASYTYPLTQALKVQPSLLLAGGEVHWRKGFYDAAERDDQHTTSLVIIPGLNVSYTVLPWMQIAAGGGYRWVGAGESSILSQTDMQGIEGNIGLRFGRF
jgi:hypothetical protein